MGIKERKNKFTSRVVQKVIEVCDIILIDRGNKILMQLRDNKKNIYSPNRWGLLGGEKNKDESCKKCAIREIQEEIGLKINDPRLLIIIEDKNKEIIYRHYIYYKIINKKNSKLTLKEGRRINLFTLREINKLNNKVEWFERVYLKPIKLALDKKPDKG